MSEIYNCQNLKDYLFCGLYYRYKHEFNLPYKPINANEIYAQSMNAAIFIIINGWGLKRKHPRTFIAEAAEEFKDNFYSLSENCRDTERLIELYAQGLIAINTILEYIDITKDIVAIFNYPFTIDLDNDAFVSSNIDLMVIRDDKDRTKRSYEFISFLDDKTYNRIQNYDHIDIGISRYFIEHILEQKLEYPCNHRYLSYFGIPKMATKVSKYSLDISLEICRNTVALIRKGVHLPNSSKTKCLSCPYNKICDQKFVIKNTPKSWISSAKRILNER